MSEQRASTRVFSQRAAIQPDEHALIVQARHHFSTELTFSTRQFSGAGEAETGRLDVEVKLDGETETHRLEMIVRRTTERDWRDAERAEIAGRAGGMATLARRCTTIWEIDEPSSPLGTRALLVFCGALTLVELGPVMPASCNTLYGTRGTRERLEKLTP